MFYEKYTPNKQVTACIQQMCGNEENTCGSRHFGTDYLLFRYIRLWDSLSLKKEKWSP